MKIGEKIKEMRIEKELSQKELSQKICIAQNTLSQFESGKANPSYDILILIAKYFNVTSDYLLGMEDDFGIKGNAENNSSYNYDERELIDIYRRLPDERKKSVINFAKDNFQLASGETYEEFLKFKKA